MARADPHLPEAVECLAASMFPSNTLPLWGFMHAQRLGHPDPQALEGQFERTYAHLHETAAHFWTLRVEEAESVRRGIAADLDAAAEWSKEFERAEADLVARGAEASFAEVERELTARRIGRVRPPDRGLIFAPWDPRTRFGRYVIPGLLLLALYVQLRRRQTRRAAERRRLARSQAH